MQFGLRIIRSQSVMLVTFKAFISKGQKEWRQTTRAIGHVKKRCKMESRGNEQREQLVSRKEEWIDCEIRTLVGIMFQTIFQRKSFKRWFKLSFQRDFQEEEERGEGWGGKIEQIWWCADLVEKTPVEEGVHKRRSEVDRMVILRISETMPGSNKKHRRFFL
jgi:hypothetical protein